MQILDDEKHPDAKLGRDGNRTAGALYDLIAQMPRQHEKGVGCHCPCFIFGNNWNQAAWREGAELVLIHLRDKWEILGCYASELQEDIALSRGSIAENPLAIFPGFPQKAPELVTMTQGPVFEIAIDTGAVQSGLAFPAKQF